MKNSYTIEIDAPPAQVFQWLEDPERLKQWLPNLVENERDASTATGTGSKFRQVYVENGRRMEMQGEVTQFERNRHLACDIRGEVFDLFVDYRLEDLGGRTRLTQESEVRFRNAMMRIVGAVLKPLMKKSSMKQLESSFVKLKALAETG